MRIAAAIPGNLPKNWRMEESNRRRSVDPEKLRFQRDGMMSELAHLTDHKS